ncbi:hypothetical protein [Bradyrhizobium lablabi]|uniref:hypothetical protein n=1 Tax=Bradyrhizobium lablabi TaxID=722472 RepID=UPI001BA8EE29|nr:hypothetical protein [Bradyrhizobium lablabi]MBR0697806.1 hypothetical protein [Bradyrhizobium lablabi]
MSTKGDPRAELLRLQRALEAVSDDLDEIERRSHWSLRAAAKTLSDSHPPDIETFVGNFAFAVRRGVLA